MSIPSLQITDQGIEAPTTQEVIAGLWQLFQDAFGADLSTNIATPQGQLVTSLAAVITDERNQWISLMNQIDPRYSQGIWQDAIGSIYFMTRKQAVHSTARLTVIGLRGTVIPAGFQFLDVNNQAWQTLERVVIDGSGQALVSAQAMVAGEVIAAPNTINTIPKALSGLDRVFNEYGAIVGVNEESRTDFELRRRESVALNSKNTNAATHGAVANINNVQDVYVVDNPTDLAVKVGSSNYSIIRNSILVSVVGGDADEIAKTILAKAGTGCSFNGNTEVVVRDTENYHDRPPEYLVKFLRPKQVPIYFQIELESKAMMSYQDEEAIKNAILKAMADGATRAHIGQAVIASRFICPVASAIPNLGIVSLRVGKSEASYQDKIAIGVDEYPVTNQYQIKVISS